MKEQQRTCCQSRCPPCLCWSSTSLSSSLNEVKREEDPKKASRVMPRRRLGHMQQAPTATAAMAPAQTIYIL